MEEKCRCLGGMSDFASFLVFCVRPEPAGLIGPAGQALKERRNPGEGQGEDLEEKGVLFLWEVDLAHEL
uniref:Uncharacterized protein n=1 Tax=Panagrellus redivivus TaxID=6233 RepID=A0A7E4W652_PANRE